MANEQIEKIRFWCQTVLPTVYDDSLSYYECLSKFAEKLNEIVAFVNNLAYDIPDGSITTVKLANGAVTNEKLGAASVTNDKLGDNAVTSTKIANGAVTGAKITIGASGTVDKYVAVDASGNLIKGSGIDTTVTQNSGNLITSGAVYSYIQSLDANGVKY